jgi:hypothetical protein
MMCLSVLTTVHAYQFFTTLRLTLFALPSPLFPLYMLAFGLLISQIKEKIK